MLSDAINYEDADLRMWLPLYLRPKRGMRFFAPLGKKSKDAIVYSMAVEFIDNQFGIDLYQSQFATHKTGTEWEMGGVKTTILRQGKSSFVDDGVEVLSKVETLVTHDLLFGYNIFFKLGDRHLHALIGGQRDQTEFEVACKQIVSSIELKHGGYKDSPKENLAASGGLKPTDKARLIAVLNKLPLDLEYLRKPIMTIAKEDQDLLGSGEADTSPIERALRKAAGQSGIGSTAAAHAEVLRTWLEALPDRDGAWAGPVGFVEGFLRGRALFGDDAAEA